MLLHTTADLIDRRIGQPNQMKWSAINVACRRCGVARDSGPVLIIGQREPPTAVALADHDQLAGTPVDVIELERGDLPARLPAVC